MLHGLFTDRNHDFAEILAAAICSSTGLCVYRFDFRSHRDPAWIFPGYEGDLNDVKIVINMLHSRLSLSVAAIVGHSKGANVALMHAAEQAEAGLACVPTVVLAPRFHMSGMPSSLFSPAELASLKGPGAVETFSWTPRSGGTVIITQKMLDAVSSIDMLTVVNRIPDALPVLLLHGSKDKTIPVTDAEAFTAARPLIKKLILRTSHVFSDERAKMVQAVVGFIKLHCVRAAASETATPLSAAAGASSV